LLVHPFYRNLLRAAVDYCTRLNDVVVLPMQPLVTYTLESFDAYQRHCDIQCQEERRHIIQTLVEYLCQSGQTYIYDALQQVPFSISMDHFNSLRVNQASTSIAIETVGKNTSQSLQLLSGAGANTNSHTLGPHTLHSTMGTPDSMSLTKDSLASKLVPALAPAPPVTDNASRLAVVSYTERAAIRNNCRSIAGLFRLVDFMVRDAAAHSVLDGVLRLQSVILGIAVHEGREAVVKSSLSKKQIPLDPAWISRNNRASNVLFRLVVGIVPKMHSEDIQTFDEEETSQSTGESFEHFYSHQDAALKYELSFDLSKDDIVNSLKLASKRAIISANLEGGMLTHDECMQLLVPIFSELKPILPEDRIMPVDAAVQSVLQQCYDAVMFDYEKAKKHLKTVDFLCDAYGKHLRIFQYAENTQLSSMVPEDMASFLSMFQDTLTKCSLVEDVQDVGVMRLEFTGLKNKLNHAVINCQISFHRIIPDIYVAHGDAFYAELSRLTDVLDSKYTTLDEFVRVVELFNKTSLETDKWTDKFNYIMTLKEIIEQNVGVAQTDHILRQNLTIANAWQRYSHVMNEFENMVEGKSKMFQSQLKQRTRALVEPLEVSRLYLHGTEINDHGSDADNVLVQLSAFQSEIDNVLKKGVELEHYQKVLKFTAYHHSIMLDLAHDIHARFILWSLVKLIKELEISFMSVNFLDAGIGSVEKQLRYVQHTLSHRLNHEKPNAVQIWLDDALKNLQVIAPLIKKLQAPTLQPKHIARIHESIGRCIFEEEDITVGELIDVIGILKFSSEIDFVYEESLFEYNLEASSRLLHKKLLSCEFEFEADKDNAALVYVSNFEELEIFMDDVLISLQACANSRYSAPHLSQFENEEESLRQWIICNQQFKHLQEGYLRIRVLFTSARTARYLSSSVKHFKALDEAWRTVIKHARLEKKIAGVYGSSDMRECLIAAAEAISETDKELLQHINDQCQKYPKMYLLDSMHLMEVFATLEPYIVFHKCRAMLFPHISEVVFMEDDPHTNKAIVSGDCEKILFRKPCSTRSSLVDWFRAIDLALTDRVESDIRDYMAPHNRHILEDLRMPKTTCEQSRIVAVQVNFWSLLTHNIQTNAQLRYRLVQGQMLELCDQISLYSSLVSKSLDKYHIRTTENVLILLISHRDLLNNLLSQLVQNGDDDTLSSSFVLQESIKKVWDPSSSSIVVKHGFQKLTYGMKYTGFSERLVITPLTDRFFVAINNAINFSSIPVVVGPEGQGKRHIVAALAKELGYEVFNVDCATFPNIQGFYRTLRAHLAAGFWCNYCNINATQPEIRAVCLSILSATCVALLEKAPYLLLSGQKLEIIQNSAVYPRFALFCNANSLQEQIYFPPSVRQQFRLLSFAEPDRKAILTVVLTANRFAFVPRLVIQLEGLFEYLLQYNLCPESILLKLAVKCIYNARLHPEHAVQNAATQIGLIVKLIVGSIPWNLQDKLTEEDLRYICNLFMETIYTPEQDLKSFKKISSSTDCAQILYDHIRYQSVQSVIVVGSQSTGKTTLIKEITGNAINDHNLHVMHRRSTLQTAVGHSVGNNANTSSNSVDIPGQRKLALYSRMLNVFTMADYSPPTKNSEFFNADLAPSSHAPLTIAAQEVLHEVLRGVDALGDTQVIHFDTHDSLQLAHLLSHAEFLASYYARPVRFVWECVELLHADPAMVSKVPMVRLNNRIFDVEDVLSYQLKLISVK
jgi:hypothetical protein